MTGSWPARPVASRPCWTYRPRMTIDLRSRDSLFCKVVGEVGLRTGENTAPWPDGGHQLSDPAIRHLCGELGTDVGQLPALCRHYVGTASRPAYDSAPEKPLGRAGVKRSVWAVNRPVDTRTAGSTGRPRRFATACIDRLCGAQRWSKPNCRHRRFRPRVRDFTPTPRRFR